jgi:hypothetical protein
MRPPGSLPNARVEQVDEAIGDEIDGHEKDRSKHRHCLDNWKVIVVD